MTQGRMNAFVSVQQMPGKKDPLITTESLCSSCAHPSTPIENGPLGTRRPTPAGQEAERKQADSVPRSGSMSTGSADVAALVRSPAEAYVRAG